MRICLYVFLAAGCVTDVEKSTGETFWDLGTQFIDPKADLSAGTGLKFPLTLTPLTPPQTQTANISLYFQVTDRDGEGVPGLCGGLEPSPCPHNDFLHKEDGVEVDPTESNFTVKPLSGSTLRIPTVLVIDVSGSVANKLTDIKAAAKAIVDGMIDEQSLALMVFADSSQVRQTFTKDKVLLKAAIDDIDKATVGVATNLFGAATQAVGMWQDGFQDDPTMTMLTTGLAIILTDGADDTALTTFEDFVSARGNKRVITVGIDQNAAGEKILKQMQTAGYIAETSYAALVSDIAAVTQRILTLAHSIYAANYCSPKRAGMHELVFTVIGNSDSAVSAICNLATFDPSAPSICAQGGEETFTQVCQQLGQSVTCCPYNAPYWCESTHQCYLTAADAQTACGDKCYLCGGTGTGNVGDFSTVAGPAIHVNFNAQGYGSNQCPYFWGPKCKELQACCPNVVPTNQQSSCVQQLNSAQGIESTCTTQLQQYCPVLMMSCLALQDCCDSYDPGTTIQTDCQDELFNAHGSEPTCTMTNGHYCPSPSPMPNCFALKNCCQSLGGSTGKNNCLQEMTNLSSEIQCTQSKNKWCPTAPACMMLSTCCAGFGPQGQQSCYNTLSNANNSAPACTFGNMAFCPMGTNCMNLKTCCANKSGSMRDDCEQDLVNAQGQEGTCSGYLTQNGC